MKTVKSNRSPSSINRASGIEKKTFLGTVMDRYLDLQRYGMYTKPRLQHPTAKGWFLLRSRFPTFVGIGTALAWGFSSRCLLGRSAAILVSTVAGVGVGSVRNVVGDFSGAASYHIVSDTMIMCCMWRM